MLVDTHAHLDFPDMADDVDAIIDRAHHAGVSKIICISTTLDSASRTLQLARKFPGLHATAGIHPCYVESSPDDFLPALRNLAREPEVSALGEIGIDYYRQPQPDPEDAARPAWESNRNKQRRFFDAQLNLAIELGLNAVVHQRESWEDTLSILRPFAGKLRAVFHCFGGTLAQALELLDLGFLVSFTGIVTFPKATTVQECAARLPKGSFFLETDCPFLAPVPHRGRRCEPAYVRLIAEHIAQLRGETLAELAEHTSQAAHDFFQRRTAPVPNL